MVGSIASFTLVGGPLHRLLGRSPPLLPGSDQLTRLLAGVGYKAVLAAALSWGALLALAVADGVAFPGRVGLPFLYDLGAYGRYLIGLPLLLIMEPIVDRGLQPIVAQLAHGELIPREERPAFDRALARLSIERDAVLPVLVILGLALIPLENLVLTPGHLIVGAGGHTTWRTIVDSDGNAHLSLPGWWHVYVGTTLYRFVLYRWLWRMTVWALFLRRLGKLKLKLIPTHPDLAGGVGFLSLAQRRFGVLFFAVSIVLCSTVANLVVWDHVPVAHFKYVLAGYIAVSQVFLLGPLFFLLRKLVTAKRIGLIEYGALADLYTANFDEKWIRGKRTPDERLLGSQDIQALADMGTSFAVIREMHTVPIDKQAIISGIALAGAPMLPLLLLSTSVENILHAVLKLIM